MIYIFPNHTEQDKIKTNRLCPLFSGDLRVTGRMERFERPPPLKKTQNEQIVWMLC